MPSSEPSFQHKKASLNSRAPQEKEGRPKPLLLNMEDQVWIESEWPKKYLRSFSLLSSSFPGPDWRTPLHEEPPKDSLLYFLLKAIQLVSICSLIQLQGCLKFLFLTDNKKTPITPNFPTPGSFPANARADTWRSGGCKEIATGRQPLHRQGF